MVAVFAIGNFVYENIFHVNGFINTLTCNNSYLPVRKSGHKTCYSTETVIKELRINHVLVLDEDWEKLMLACEELDYDKSSIIKNGLQGFFRRYHDYYVRAGILDAEARGMATSEHFTILRDKSEDDLLPYGDKFPDFGKSPIDLIPPLPKDPQYRRGYNTIKLSRYNFVLLRVAHIIYRDSYPQIVGRMIRSHLADNWESAYLPQIARDKLNDYK